MSETLGPWVECAEGHMTRSGKTGPIVTARPDGSWSVYADTTRGRSRSGTQLGGMIAADAAARAHGYVLADDARMARMRQEEEWEREREEEYAAMEAAALVAAESACCVEPEPVNEDDIPW